jgi:hypothetical protein
VVCRGAGDNRLEPLVLPDAERRTLRGWVTRRKTVQELALWARIVLAWAEGRSNTAVSARLGINRIVTPPAGALLRACAASSGSPAARAMIADMTMRRSLGQSLGIASGAFLVTETKTDMGFELVGVGEKDRVVAFERRARRGQRAEGFVEVAVGCPDPGPV